MNTEYTLQTGKLMKTINGKVVLNKQFAFDYDGDKANILLKQGYYDYLYLVKDSSAPDFEHGIMDDIEGNHFATDNLYTVFVYYADFEGYDRVIGFAQWNTDPY